MCKHRHNVCNNCIVLHCTVSLHCIVCVCIYIYIYIYKTIYIRIHDVIQKHKNAKCFINTQVYTISVTHLYICENNHCYTSVDKYTHSMLYTCTPVNTVSVIHLYISKHSQCYTPVHKLTQSVLYTCT